MPESSPGLTTEICNIPQTRCFLEGQKQRFYGNIEIISILGASSFYEHGDLQNTKENLLE